MLTKKVRAVLVALVLAGCSDPAGVRQDGIEVQLDASGVTIHNGRRDSIYIFASERQTAALIDWVLCTDPPQCYGIAPGATRRLDKETVVGWGQSNEVIVWWWHLVPASGGGLRADSVRAVVVRQGQ